MDRYKRYFGVIIFLAAVVLMIFAVITILSPRIAEWNNNKTHVEQVSANLEQKKIAEQNVIKKLNALKQSVMLNSEVLLGV